MRRISSTLFSYSSFGEIFGQIFQYIAGAGRTAAVKKQPGHLVFFFKTSDQSVQLSLIISVVHVKFFTPYKSVKFSADNSSTFHKSRFVLPLISLFLMGHILSLFTGSVNKNNCCIQTALKFQVSCIQTTEMKF